jgi:membrane-associated protease RseP (regulator of RpoE activity)
MPAMKTTTTGLLLLGGLLAGPFAAADEPVDGKTTSGSQSISVSVSSSTQDDGVNEPKSQVSGKIMITGPDGVRKEFNLGDALPEGVDLNIDGLQNQFELLTQPADAGEPRPMIGVMSEPVSELLRKHLKLGINGVVVTGVPEKMPAAKAGIMKDDIILTADGKNITNPNDLAVVVKESADREFDVVLMRDGEKKTIRLKAKVTTPADLPGTDIGSPNKNMGQFLLKGFGPGIQLQNDGDMNKQISELLQQAREAALEARQINGQGKDPNRELARLKARVAELEKRMKDAKISNNVQE